MKKEFPHFRIYAEPFGNIKRVFLDDHEIERINDVRIEISPQSLVEINLGFSTPFENVEFICESYEKEKPKDE